MLTAIRNGIDSFVYSPIGQRELARVSGEGSSLAAYRDGVVTIVAKCDHEGPVRVVQDVGAERPIHATAVGKAIAAFLPLAELEGLLARLGYERYTPRTIVQRGALEAEFRRIRGRDAPMTTRSTSRESAASRPRSGSTAVRSWPRSARSGRRAA